ncbi:hypothetical protein GCM10010404_49270 [Nonomuraea africana]
MVRSISLLIEEGMAGVAAHARARRVRLQRRLARAELGSARHKLNARVPEPATRRAFRSIALGELYAL